MDPGDDALLIRGSSLSEDIVSETKFKTFRPFSDEQLAALEQAHGEIRVCRGAVPPPRRWVANDSPEPPWEAVFRKPTMGESDNFEGSAHREQAKAAALRNLAKAIVVGVSVGGKVITYEDRSDAKAVRDVRDAWDNLRRDFPGAHMAAQEDLMSLAGMAAEEAGKD